MTKNICLIGRNDDNPAKIISPLWGSVIFPYLATFETKEFQSELLLLSCWNVGNSESFPYFNRNSVGVNCPKEERMWPLIVVHPCPSVCVFPDVMNNRS